MSDEWLVDVLGEIAAYADHRSLKWLYPLIDEAHVMVRRELILKGSVSLQGFQVVAKGQDYPRNDEPSKAVSAQVIDFEQFRLLRADLSSMNAGQVGFSVN